MAASGGTAAPYSGAAAISGAACPECASGAGLRGTDGPWRLARRLPFQAFGNRARLGANRGPARTCLRAAGWRARARSAGLGRCMWCEGVLWRALGLRSGVVISARAMAKERRYGARRGGARADWWGLVGPVRGPRGGQARSQGGEAGAGEADLPAELVARVVAGGAATPPGSWLEREGLPPIIGLSPRRTGRPPQIRQPWERVEGDMRGG